MAEIHFDDALNYLIDQLANVPEPGVGRAKSRQMAYGADIWIDKLSGDFWAARGVPRVFTMGDQDEKVRWAIHARGSRGHSFKGQLDLPSTESAT